MTPPSADYAEQLAARRREYLEWIVATFSPREAGMAPLDGRRWSLNHARLALDVDTDRASQYFAGISLTIDRDFMGTRLLKTLLDFSDSGRLSGEARDHLTGIIAGWEMNDFSSFALWPRQHTENHDIMFLHLGLFSKLLSGESIDHHVAEIKQWLAWRFERGFYEWSSHRYQFHTSNALLTLIAHAPDTRLKKGAEALFNVMLAERALFSLGGYAGGPFMRGYDSERGCAYLSDNRYDAFLPTVWQAFGVGEPRFDYESSPLEPAGDGFGNGQDPRLNQDEGMFFATSTVAPHPIVRALLADSSTRPELTYMGKRATAGYPELRLPPSDPKTNQLKVMYNTPHISMGSVQYIDGSYRITSKAPSRWWSVTFPASPAAVLRTTPEGWEAPKVVQHRGWLVSEGALAADSGLEPTRRGDWNIYHVGEGLCAHMELDGWHIVQVSDTTRHATLEALQRPTIDGTSLHAITLDGDRLQVDLQTMALTINGELRDPLIDMLHDSEPMRSVYGTGVIDITTSAGPLTINGPKILGLEPGDLSATRRPT